MVNKLLALGIALAMLFSVFALTGCEKEDEEMKEMTSIHFYTTESFMPWQDHKYYDFVAMTYSTKRIVDESYDTWEGEREEYSVKATFTEEQAKAFFKSVRGNGIFDLEENYHDDDLLDGWDWRLIITFADETTFESGGYVKYPEQEETINEAFLSLTGYRLFTSLWEDANPN
ncbi:MAG: hypothetical protein WC292_03840 [Clostridia bacterium]